MNGNPFIVIILGRAGSGKGTQAKLLVEKLNLAYVGSGELLRARAKKADFTGQKLGECMKVGSLVPTSLVFTLWLQRMEDIKKYQSDGFKGILFDGSPRKLKEAELLSEALEWYGWQKNIKVLLIDISRKEAFNRLAQRRVCSQCGNIAIDNLDIDDATEKCAKCGGPLIMRHDDHPMAINERLDLFEEEVMPVVEYFEKQGLLVKINGEQSVEKVQREILEKLAEV